VNFLKPILQIDLLKNFWLNKEPSLETLEFIKDGKVICNILTENLHEIKVIPTFDFILYSCPDSKNSEIINKKILYHFPLNSEDLIIEKTNYIFMLTELNLEEAESQLKQSIKIELISKKYNYFIVNNKINTPFLTYFLKKYYDYNLSSNKYNIKIIDENILVKTVNGLLNKEILLNKNNFEIETSSESINILKSSDLEEDYSDLPDLIPVEQVQEPELKQDLEEDYIDIDNFN
jgi:hypothetical protein